MWAGEDKLSFEINAVQGSGKEQHDRNSHPIQLSSLYSVPRPVLGPCPCYPDQREGLSLSQREQRWHMSQGLWGLGQWWFQGFALPMSRGHSTTERWEQRTDRREDANVRHLLGSCRMMGNLQWAPVSSSLKVCLSLLQAPLPATFELEAPSLWLDNGQHIPQHTLS